MFKFKKLRLSYLAILALFFIDLYIAIYLILPNVIVNPFFTRDIDRALALFSGNIVLVGSDTNGGGYTTGPLFYFLITPFLVFSSEVKFLATAILCIGLFSRFVLANIISRISKAQLLLCYALVVSFYCFRFPFVWMNNATFIGILFPIPLFLAYKFFLTHKGDLRIWLLSNLCIGLFAHVHYSFLYFWILNTILLFSKEISPKGRIVRVFFSVVCIFVCSIPLVLEILKGALNPIYGEVLFAQSDSHGNYFFQYWLTNYARLTEFNWSSGQLAHFETFGLVLAFILIGFRRMYQSKEGCRFLKALYFQVLLVLLIYGGMLAHHNSPHRYVMVVFLSILPLLAFELNSLLNTKIRKIFFAVCFFALIFMGFNRFSNSVYDRIVDDLGRNSVADVDAVCKYFNRLGISYWSFHFNVSEIEKQISASSFATARNCFSKISGNDLDIPIHYYLIDKEFFKQSEVNPRLDEILNSLPSYPVSLKKLNLEKDFKGRNYYLFSMPKPIGDREVYLSNLGSPYDLDPPFLTKGINQLTKLNTYYRDFFTGEDFYSTDLCEDSGFCELFANISIESGEITVRLVSRVLQTIYELTPISIRLKNVGMKYKCDEQNRYVFVSSQLGVEVGRIKNMTNLTPVIIREKIKCKNFEIKTLSAEEMYIKHSRFSETKIKKDVEFPFEKVN
jgi:hypothetical protein